MAAVLGIAWLILSNGLRAVRIEEGGGGRVKGKR